jgi:hypothetical protein
MSWHFSQALVEEFSEDTSLDGEPCAPLKSSRSVGRCCSDARWMDAYRSSLSGMTCRPSTASRGEGASMSSVAGFPARTFPPPGVVPELMAHAPASGHIWQELSVKYDLDSSSWRTHRCLFDEDLPWSSVTLPRWGMMLAGVCWELTMSERHISASGSGLLPTPLSTLGTNGGPNQRDSSGRPGLQMAARTWPTPTTQDNCQTAGQYTSKTGTTLGFAARYWPTPNARDWKDTGESQGTRKSPNLGTMVHRTPLWPTPTASTGGPEPDGKTGRKLVTQVQQKTQAGGQLNPTWVEWLMGWPIGWTDLEPLATDKFQQWQRQRGCC